MSDATVNGVLSIAPNAVCDEDQALLAEVRERNNELSQRVGHMDSIIKSVRAMLDPKTPNYGDVLEVLNR